ncbi:hypothetical protein D3C71_1833400 [compost metagenome]
MARFDFVDLVNDKQYSLLVARHHPSVETFIDGESTIIGFDNPQDEIKLRENMAIQRFIFFIPLLTLAYTG